MALRFSRIRAGQAKLAERFSNLHLLWGHIEKKDYVTGFEVFIFADAEWKKLKTNPNKFDYMRRTSAYNDWEKILRNYEIQKK